MSDRSLVHVIVVLATSLVVTQASSATVVQPDSVAHGAGLGVTASEQQQPVLVSCDHGWYEYPIAVVTGVLVSWATIRLQSRHDRKARLRQEARKYAVVARSARDELRLYEDKLRQLSSEFKDIISALRNRSERVFLVPSYGVYPAFLEHVKLQLSEFYREESLVRQLSACHFELEHIRDRLEEAKRALRASPPEPAGYPANLAGFVLLLDNDVKVFAATAQSLDDEARKATDGGRS